MLDQKRMLYFRLVNLQIVISTLSLFLVLYEWKSSFLENFLQMCLGKGDLGYTPIHKHPT